MSELYPKDYNPYSALELARQRAKEAATNLADFLLSSPSHVGGNIATMREMLQTFGQTDFALHVEESIEHPKERHGFFVMARRPGINLFTVPLLKNDGSIQLFETVEQAEHEAFDMGLGENSFRVYDASRFCH